MRQTIPTVHNLMRTVLVLVGSLSNELGNDPKGSQGALL